ncbi:MAG: 5-(carboxyamino)imidazole ribonucleotide synthase [Haloferacaceae archaeon]
MTVTVPGPTIGVVGGGQLGRMLAEAAAPLGVDVVALDPTPACPASVAADQIEGAFDDPDAVRALAERADVLTYEIELADPDLLESVGEEFDVPVHPDPDTLRTIQDKFVQNEALAAAGVPIADYRRVDSPGDLADAAADHDGVMLKARTGGYDGRGNVPVAPGDDPEAALAEVTGDVDDYQGTGLAERLVPFDRELSVIGVKGAGEVRTFTVGENVHEDEILRETVVPARASDAVRERAEEVARDVLEMLDGRGTYGIELFQRGEEILVNEIAPRPHNSGHWTIEGAVTSQFEQHARAVLGWPLGATDRRCPTVMTNLLGDVERPQPAQLRGVDDVLAAPGAALHWYGKHEARPLRKMGHVTVVPAAGGTGGDPTEVGVEELLSYARELREGVTFAETSE